MKMDTSNLKKFRLIAITFLQVTWVIRQKYFNVSKICWFADLLFKLEELSDQLDEVVLFKSPFKKKNETPLSIQSYLLLK